MNCYRCNADPCTCMFPRSPGARLAAGLGGLRVVTVPTSSPFCVSEWAQFRFPRSKRRRIRAKWRKDRRNWKRIPTGEVYQIGDTLYMHPDMMAKLAEKIGRDKDDRIAREIFG